MAGGIANVGKGDLYELAHRDPPGKYDYFISHIGPYKFKVTKMNDADYLGHYEVQRIHGWDFDCTCPAGQNRKDCKHVKWVKEVIKETMLRNKSEEIIP